jgi:hypothetical protein
MAVQAVQSMLLQAQAVEQEEQEDLVLLSSEGQVAEVEIEMVPQTLDLVEEPVVLMLQVHKDLIAQQQVEQVIPEFLEMLELEALEGQQLEQVMLESHMAEVVAELKTMTITTWQVEQVLQAMPLSTNHPLYFYFA